MLHERVQLVQHPLDERAVVPGVLGARQVLHLPRIVRQVVQRHVARGVEIVHRTRVPVLLRAEPAHQLVLAVHDCPEEGAATEVRCAIPPPRLVQLLDGIHLRRRPGAHVGERLERAADRPVLVERVQPVPAEQGTIAGRARAASRSVRCGVQHHAAEAPPLEVRVAIADLLLAEPRKLEQGGNEVEVRAHRRRTPALRCAGRADGEVDDGGLVEVNRPLLRHPVRAVHLAMVTREDDDGVVPEIEAVERVEDATELVVHEAHAVDEVVAPPEPEVLAIVGDAPVVQIEQLLVVPNAHRLQSIVVVEVVGHLQVPLRLEPAQPLLGRLQPGHRAVGMRRFDRIGLVEHDVVRVHEAAHEQPGLVESRCAMLQPVHRLEHRGAVELRAMQRRAEHLAPLLVVGEAVALERVLAARHLRQVPLPLEGRVVAVLAQQVPDGGDVG